MGRVESTGVILYLGVSKNNGTPKSSILIGFSIINHPFWGTPIFGNTHLLFFLFRCCELFFFQSHGQQKVYHDVSFLVRYEITCDCEHEAMTLQHKREYFYHNGNHIHWLKRKVWLKLSPAKAKHLLSP